MLHVLDFLRSSALLRHVSRLRCVFFEIGGTKIAIIPIIFTIGSPKGKRQFFPALTSFNSYGILRLNLWHLKTDYLFLILFLSSEDEYSRMAVAYSYPYFQPQPARHEFLPQFYGLQAMQSSLVVRPPSDLPGQQPQCGAKT